MEIYPIEIPPIEFLSDFLELDSLLPPGKVIVDKGLCGCGATEYYLRLPDLPVLLLSPRKLLIQTKLDGNPTPEEQTTGIFAPHHRPFKALYFDRSKGQTPQQSLAELGNYLLNPLCLPWFVPKIMVTYDSFPMVLGYLRDTGQLGAFTIVVDEFPALYTDVKLKGTKELKTLSLLDSLQNRVVYLSATPIKEKFLAPLPAFSRLPYVQLIWPAEMIRNVRVKTEPMKSVSEKIAEIIAGYRRLGYLRTAMVKGVEVYSREAVFYVNSVSSIVKIIEKCGLTPQDTLVLCSDEPENRRKLGSFPIGMPPGPSEYQVKNKPFTFVTRVCFEGADLYSDCSSSYVFSDCRVDSLSLDLSTDLPQIAGRCRTKANPFRNEITLYYKTSDALLIDRTRKAILERQSKTNEMLKSFQGITDPNALQVIEDAQKTVRYSKYYLDVEKDPKTGQSRAVANMLAIQADLRALDIKEEQYKSGYSVSTYSQQTSPASIPALDWLWRQFASSQDFPTLMRLYADTLTQSPELKPQIEAMAEVPAEYKCYYNVLGPDKLRALGYKKADVEAYYHAMSSLQFNAQAIQGRLLQILIPGQCYTNSQVKAAIDQAYSEFGVALKPTATDIANYVPAVSCRFTDPSGKRKYGYRIL